MKKNEVLYDFRHLNPWASQVVKEAQKMLMGHDMETGCPLHVFYTLSCRIYKEIVQAVVQDPTTSKWLVFTRLSENGKIVPESLWEGI
jgi:hypothetical protein